MESRVGKSIQKYYMHTCAYVKGRRQSSDACVTDSDSGGSALTLSWPEKVYPNSLMSMRSRHAFSLLLSVSYQERYCNLANKLLSISLYNKDTVEELWYTEKPEINISLCFSLEATQWVQC
ncbi:hypothetical protein KP509_28G040100 [Ceratopteris richardii]|uniref:Uncharacterized protein n=1 Tax=Ceratopteris richardii TaxID=49495 RepID=A0A8T2RDL7_CERRI|nr:hypothetical protein KP509_28G040100 [Ceratopteris richardii]